MAQLVEFVSIKKFYVDPRPLSESLQKSLGKNATLGHTGEKQTLVLKPSSNCSHQKHRMRQEATKLSN